MLHQQTGRGVVSESQADIVRTFHQLAKDSSSESNNSVSVRDGLTRKPDTATAKVITLEDDSIPQFSKMGEFADWVRGLLQTGGDIVIKSTGQVARFTNKNIKASVKKSRFDVHRKAYKALREMIGSAEYDHFEPADSRHSRQGISGQDVYYSALRIGGKLYSVKLKFDVVSKVVSDRSAMAGISTGDVKYKDHKPVEIEIAPTSNQTMPDNSRVHLRLDGAISSKDINLNDAAPASYQTAPENFGSHLRPADATSSKEVNSIDEISLGVLRGNVNPTRIENGVLRQIAGDALQLQSTMDRVEYDPKANVIYLTPNADLTTFAHEMSHAYLNNLFNLAAISDPNSQVFKDAQTLLKAFNLNSIQEFIDLAKSEEGFEKLRSMQEWWAYQTEIYLSKGSSLDPGMRGILSSFGAWVRAAYKQFKGGTSRKIGYLLDS